MAAQSTTSTFLPEPSHPDDSRIRVNGTRLMSSLHSTCEYGKAHFYGEDSTETGMARLALNDDDRNVRHWLMEEAHKIGCKVTVDQIGNIFVVRPGKCNTVPPIMMGSHLDTQPTGGRYDGILGVHAALEILRTLHDNEYATEGPIGLVNWTNEEGARFPMVTMASGVWAGSIPLEDAWNCQEVIVSNGERPKTVKEELERIGFLGTIPASYTAQPIAAHFEIHIEQGPILEDQGLKVGIVTGAQAYSWYEIEIAGKGSHAGTTPLVARKDTVLAAAKMIVASNKIAKELSGLITTGIIQAEPGSINTMAHVSRFTLDFRHPSDDELAAMVTKCKEVFDDIAKNDSERGVEVRWKCLTQNTAVRFNEDCVAAVEKSAEEVCSQLPGSSDGRKLWTRLMSGAGHDSCHVSKRCPTAMIFAPTRNGMSHTPDEYCSPEDCIISAQVMLGAVLRYDKERLQRDIKP